MGRYNIKIVTPWSAFVWLIVCVVIIIVVLPYLPITKQYPLVSTIALVGLLYFLFQRIAVRKTEWNVSKTEMVIIWTSKPAFLNGNELRLDLTEVEKCDIKWVGNYDRIQITKSDGTIIRFYHDPLSFGEDFDQLHFSFPQFINLKRKNKEKNG